MNESIKKLYLSNIEEDKLNLIIRKHLIKKIKLLNYLCEFLMAGSLILIDGLVVIPYMIIQTVFFFKNVMSDAFS